MSPERLRRAAEILRREANILWSSNTTLGNHWPARARVEQRQHDEMLALADELEAHAKGIELAEGLIEAIRDDRADSFTGE